MGIQIYIRKTALDVRGIKHTTTRELVCTGCKCTAVDVLGKYCEHCESTAEEFYENNTKVTGLSVLMTDAENMIYSDANKWGSNRKPLLKFIKQHNLTSLEWFEA